MLHSRFENTNETYFLTVRKNLEDVVLIFERLFMIRIFTLLIIFAAGNLFANETIPNNGFENWDDESTPIHWETTNKFTGQLGINPVTRTNDSHNGDYAIRLETTPTPLGQNVPGSATLGELTMDSSLGGIGISGRPLKLKGYYKHPTEGDEINILVHVFANNQDYEGTVGFGQVDISAKNEIYEEFELDIEYFSDQQPDSLNIVMITSVDSTESVVIIDDLNFDFETSVESVTESEFEIYPNPASNVIKMDLTPKTNAVYKIYDINGNLVKEGNYSNEIQISELSPGIYQLMVNDGKKKYYKFLKE